MAKSKAPATANKSAVKSDTVDSKTGKNSNALAKKPEEDKAEIASV